LGIGLAEQGVWHKAIVHYRQALKVKPNSADTLNALGDALTMTGDLVQAIAAVQRALVLKPDLVRAWANLAYIKAQACDWADYDRAAAQVLALVRQGARDVPPFVALLLPATPADRLLAARQWSAGFARGITPFSHERRPAA